MSRRVALPGTVDENKADAELTDGVLKISIPKSRVETPRKVTIK